VRFRTKALAKRRQADQLDRLPEVAKPRGWLAALALAVVVGGVIVYALVGEIPRRLDAEGVLGSEGGIVAVQSQASGEVERVLVETGEGVEPGTPVLELSTEDGGREVLESGYSGQVLEVLTAEGRVLSPGTDLFTVAAEPGARPDRAYLFLPPADASGVAPGMHADLVVSSAPSEAFGSIHADVETVSGAPVSPQQVDVLVANDLLAEEFTAAGAPILVTVALESADTPTGVAWTGGSGPDFPLMPGTIVSAEIQQGEQSVLDVVLGDR
jgi:multidrug efflux pump subunit AcrA (membrane-fusion protein)